MARKNYDGCQQRVLMAIGLMERITMDEPLDVQINLIKAFCNGTIKGSNEQTKRDDLLSAIMKIENIADNLMTAADYLKSAAVEVQRRLEAQTSQQSMPSPESKVKN